MKTPTIPRHIYTLALWAAGVIAVLVLAVLVLISLRIGADVRATAQTAMAHHEGDRVEALLLYAEDSRHTLAERNRAVWALGQLGDRRGLPWLRKHHTGEPCDHGNALCQRELAKAIKLLDGGLDVTALVWRHSVER